ncbi:B-block binding subunit of TFIIIC [Forsythia ovata]|uniref:B-block binding subunit of TFIIIC n=1 Tax=Forsythia ovata TaxID=205694 RepID=A0ABD1TUL7_9LAMI
MDTIVHSALEEICSEGANGLPIQNLWPKLGPSLSSCGLSLCPDVKRALWVNLLDIPGLKFETGVGFSCNSKEDLMKYSVEEWEQMNLKVVAPESLRNNFIGIYDIKASDSGISQPQRRALERLAIARTNGITQSELAKELGMKGNNIFYVLKKLETQGLIVRQSTVIRTKESSNEGEPKSGSTVTTNMLHLYRYAKHLGSQQRLEIIKEDKPLLDGGEVADGNAATGDGFGVGTAKEVVHVKDFLPALKDICDKLENAEGKVLVVSDIKKDLGYRGTRGHRVWRNICHRLKDACVVEECCVIVNKKEVNCLRLLKKFSPSYFEPKSHGRGHDSIDTEQPINSGKRGQATEQLVELPILRQVYDIIDAEGSKGLTITEVCKRLGIRNKPYYNRLLNMFSRFGMHLQAESHNRGVGYRVWTAGNFNPEASNVVPSEPEIAPPESTESNQRAVDLKSHENSAQSIQVVGASTSNNDVRGIHENERTTVEPESSNCPKVDAESQNMLLCPSNSQNSETEPSNRVPEKELHIVSKEVTNTAPVEMCPPAVSTPPRRRSYPRYPCLTMGATSSQREQRILKMLQEEKFLIKPELHRRLESLEKEKNTMMDRKTLERSLNKLQQEGHCKCIHVSVPVVTNCGRSRTTEVVLHPSVYNISPELVGQIHNRMRSFEWQVRSQSYSQQKKRQPVPIVDSVQRIPDSVKLDDQAERAEVMRANGFVLAKMVRTKLLHIFLWGCASSSPGWDDALLSSKHANDLKNPHSTCRLFELDKAIKFMPLELFLQVVGSNEKFEDMIEKCRRGLLLSDLPMQECKRLMDTRAIGRLSWLIDILRRLKLIRLVSKGNEDASSGSHTTLTHALELKPYIEEPVSTVALSSDFLFPDLRPQVRHDFVLSSRKAVDEYWNTLEYCYATAKSRAALHAFPGSAVHEVFHSRSWASVRVMTAEQRAELLKRVAKDEPNKKLSYRECEKIAKDLNLTLEQVLRVSYDKRQQRLSRLQGVSNAEVEDIHSIKSKGISSSRKRKKYSERKSSEFVKANVMDGQSSAERITTPLDLDDLFTEEQNSVLTSSEDYDHLRRYHSGDNIESREEPELNEVDEGACSFIHKCALSRLKPARRRKFSWTEEADRQLVIEYARYRAALGAKFHRVDWASISSLPAPPDSCRRRMALLNSYIPFRKAVMKLCNILAERYTKYLEQVQGKMLDHADSEMMDQDYAFEEENMCSSASKFGTCWDSFDDNSIKLALDDVLQYKRLAKLDASKHMCSDQENEEEKYTRGTGFTSSAPRTQEFENWEERSKPRAQGTSSRLLPRKYVKLLSEGASFSRRAHESVAVANAAELFKQIFLSTSSAPEVPTLLAETLRRYSEHDLFAAFNYLREEKIMIGGSCNSPFVLSQHFLQSISLSPFPMDTGKRAANFASWLQERETDLMEEGIDLPADLQCGEIFHLCSLVFSGELSIIPCLPEAGVGEAEDTRTSKRKHDSSEIYGDDTPKKSRTSLAGEGEIISRREKGFPGIKLQLHHATISRIHVIESYKDEDFNFVTLGKNTQINTSSLEVDCIVSHSDVADHAREILDSGRTILPAYDVSKSPWEAMTSYAEHLRSSCSYQEKSFSLQPEVFKTLYSAIQKSGDQGLSMKEISKVLSVQGKTLEIMVEVLEAFTRAIKVNAYDDIRVVDSLYRSKYFLTPVAAIRHDHGRTPLRDQKRKMDEELMSIGFNNHIDDVASRNEINMNADEEHRVTILNLPEDVADPSTEDKITGYEHSEVMSPKMDGGVEMCRLLSVDSQICRPILPWINGDGTINELVYKGLARRVLGIVMQNPGILEDDIINKMRALNPQSCRKLLEIMIMDNHIITRKMHQMTSAHPPAILSDLLGCRFKRPKSICREHFYANPTSTSLL